MLFKTSSASIGTARKSVLGTTSSIYHVEFNFTNSQQLRANGL